ncbi:MAG: YoaK family protein [Candidatus Binatia bacterium]
MSAPVEQDRSGVWTLLLAWTAGCVDAIGFLTLFALFTAHMTGNTVLVGAYLGSGEWRLGLHHLFPVPLFVLGAVIGTLMVESARRRRARSPYAAVLLLEAALLALLLIGGTAVPDALRSADTPHFLLLAALPVLAMGMQNTTLRAIGGARLPTTFVSGVLTGLGEGLAGYVIWLRDEAHRAGWSAALRGSNAHPTLRNAVATSALWLVYLLGAVSGGLAHYHWRLIALALPIAALLIVLAAELSRPRADRV